MQDPKPYTDLLPYLQNESFVIETQQQIIKDFAKFNLYLPDRFNQLPHSQDEIVYQINVLLNDFLPQGERRLLQLIYTIDIPEKEFLQLTRRENFMIELSHKILYREAMKVFLRKHFSKS